MGQDINTPLCVHCSDPLDADGRDLITGETFCGANPSSDRHESPDDIAAKAARVDRYEKNFPSWKDGTPEDVDAWLRDLIPDDKRLVFYQWIGAQAITEALDAVKKNLDNDPRPTTAQHYHRDDLDEVLELADPEEYGPYPSVLPIGRPFCNEPAHQHTDGGSRLMTCHITPEGP